MPIADLAVGKAAQAAVILQRGERGVVARDAKILGQVTDPLAADSVARRPAQHHRVARGFANDSQQNFDERGLSGTIWSRNANSVILFELVPKILKNYFFIECLTYII